MTDLLLTPTSSPARIAQTTTRQVEKGEDRTLNVELLIPKDWLKFEPYGPQPPDASGLILFGRYGSRDGKALLELYAEPIIREVASADWFDHFARTGGYKVEKAERRTSPAGTHVDAIATRPGKSGAPFVYRMSTYKDAGVVYLVTGFAHPQDFDVLQDAFVVAMKSFQLLHPIDEPSAEPLRTVNLARVLPVQLVIPQPWQRLQDPRTDVDLVHFENKGAGDAMLGKISVLVAPFAAYPSATAIASALVPTVAIVLRPGAPAALGKGFIGPQQGDASVAGGVYPSSVRVFVARLGTAWVGVARWSHPPTAERYPTDAINDRAYDIVLRTFAGT